LLFEPLSQSFHGDISIRQIAALPYRIEPDGSVRVMLITSRETQRWVIPKGNPIKGLRAHEAAAQEAFEEAGVEGIACPTQIGSYSYAKRRKTGLQRTIAVDVFPFAVTGHAEEWPEQDERAVAWFTLANAAAAVDEPELKGIIAGFREPPPTPGIADRVPAIGQEIGRKIPVLRWFQSLLPTQGRFFDLFEAHSATLVAGADALARLIQGGPDAAAHIREIVVQEQNADDIAREVLQDVRRTYVTPFDRSAITGLIGVMDDAIDQMNQTAKAVMLFEVHEFAPHMRDMSGIIVEAARVTAEAIPLLRSLAHNAGRLHTLTGRLIEIEGHADEIHDQGLKALFKASKDQPMDFVVGQEIYAHLEKIVDRFEDVANEIQGLVIDHA
jgi:predicted phosphate transport protein (TIGR00153 family)